MAWAQGDLTSSLSIIIALAACLSATTSEGREWGGLGVTGWRWEGHRGAIGLGCSDVSSGACGQEKLTLLGLVLPALGGAELWAPACPSLLIPELLHRG